MIWMTLDTWIVVIGVLCAVACALPGCFLVLRKMSMMGDAISHAVLPGLAMGFLLTGTRANITMFLGAALVGVLTAVFTQWISRYGRVDSGASMGIVFTSFFAVGILLIVRAANHVDLDPGCVLYGAIELTPLDTITIKSFSGWIVEIPRAVITLTAVLLLNVILIVLLYKEFKCSAFDPELATALGINAQVMHYVLMAMTAVTTVAAFEAVGSIIVIAMLIVPAATAYVLTRRLGMMLALASFVAALSAILGHASAIVLPYWAGLDGINTAGMMAVLSGLLFCIAWITAFVKEHARLT
jgi:manganese/zinc/iron transport system permease protein